MEVPNYTIADFLRDMGRPFLQYRKPRTTNDMWVFWSQEEREGEGGGDLDPVGETFTNNNNCGSVQEYLKYLLCKADVGWDVLLIQFWAPIATVTSSTIGERFAFKTSNQPFALRGISRRICEYWKRCTSLEFNFFQDEEKDCESDFGSTIGRVFRKKKVESFHNIVPNKYGYTLRSLLLPLFKPSSRCCSGVLELIGFKAACSLSFEISNLSKVIFKEANFMKPSPFESQESTEIEEINKALQGVCTTHQLPLAQIWIPCCTSTAMAYVDNPGERCHSPYLSCSRKFSSSISQNGNEYFYNRMKGFNDMCNYYDFRMGQSIVGKTFLYHKSRFCRDINQLPEAEYPLSVYARIFGLIGCCTIWLHITRTKKHNYVLEFFLPPWDTISGDLQRYLELLLTTVKKQLPGFKISSVGEESCVEVCEISVNDDEPGSIIISQTFSVKPVPESFVNVKEMVQNEVVGETVIDNGSNILDLEENGMVVCHSEKTAGKELFVEAATDNEITRRLPPMPESLRNENEVVLSDDEPTMEEAVRMNELKVGIDEVVTSSKRIISRAEASEREYRTTDITISYEDLRKHFGKKLDDASKILEVSRSTMKRVCRRHDIKKWPAPKRKKVNVLPVFSGNEGIEGTYKGDSLCSDPPPTPTIAGISHKTTNSRQEQDVGTVTVKATHGGHTIRFGLPFLSRKTDLVKQVIKRLPLNEGSFNIKYQDEENDWILIACDEDLEQCIGIWKGKSTIKMLVEPITNQTP